MTLAMFFACIHPDDLAMVSASWQAALAGKPYHIEHRIMVGQTVRWLEERAELEFDGQGQACKATGFVQDITGRKLAEQAISESEVRFRTLFEKVSVAIMIHDRDTGCILAANNQAIRSYGYATLAELQANDFWLPSPYSFDDAVRLIRKTTNEGRQRFEWKNQTIYGRVFWEDVLLDCINLSGCGAGLVSHYRHHRS